RPRRGAGTRPGRPALHELPHRARRLSRVAPDRAGTVGADMSAIPVSATLAANEILIRKRQAGEPVLPLSFGEAGLPLHPLLPAALTGAAGRNAYRPRARLPVLRGAAPGYWARRRRPPSPGAAVP